MGHHLTRDTPWDTISRGTLPENAASGCLLGRRAFYHRTTSLFLNRAQETRHVKRTFGFLDWRQFQCWFYRGGGFIFHLPGVRVLGDSAQGHRHVLPGGDDLGLTGGAPTWITHLLRQLLYPTNDAGSQRF